MSEQGPDVCVADHDWGLKSTAMIDVVSVAMNNAVDRAVWRAMYGAVEGPVGGAVYWAVEGAVFGAVGDEGARDPR